MRLTDHTCAFCFADRAALRFDRKSRPYVACGACGARAFLVGMREAVRWLAIAQPLLTARAEELTGDPEASARARQQEARVAAALRTVLAPPRDRPIEVSAGSMVQPIEAVR